MTTLTHHTVVSPTVLLTSLLIVLVSALFKIYIRRSHSRAPAQPNTPVKYSASKGAEVIKQPAAAPAAPRRRKRDRAKEKVQEWAIHAHKEIEDLRKMSAELAQRLSERARSTSPKGPSFLRRGFSRARERRAQSASPLRHSYEEGSGFLGANERRRLRKRALSPTLRVLHSTTSLPQRNFGQHVASALGERSALRLTQSHTLDGSPRKTKPTRKEKEALNRTLPLRNTTPDATHLPESLLPSDEQPWDRLHVWLVEGEGLPYRPRWWPFEPYVVVTAVGSDTGSTPDARNLARRQTRSR